MKTSELIKGRIEKAGARYWANDNISKFIETDAEKQALIDEAEKAFEGVLDSLVIDRAEDPNSQGTARRLAKMYFLEKMRGRYTPCPVATAFPNKGEDTYDGMLVVRAEIQSMCSHHHENVTGVAYIGIIFAGEALGLSKYIRLAQWEAERGTLQETLSTRIADLISVTSGSKDVAVYIAAKHGCISCRGVNQKNSTAQTTVLRGSFKTDPDVRAEFYQNLSMQTQMETRG